MAVATLTALLALSGTAAPIPIVPVALRPPTALATISSGYVRPKAAVPWHRAFGIDRGTIQTTRSGTEAVNLLEVDQGTPQISLQVSLAGDRITSLETTTSQADRQSVKGTAQSPRSIGTCGRLRQPQPRSHRTGSTSTRASW